MSTATMSNTTVSGQVDAVMSGKRKYITDAAARVIASDWHGGQSSALYSLASCGAITDVDRLRAEIQRDADSVANDPDAPDTAYAQLLALDIYVSRVRRTRKPVKGWSELWLS